MDMPKVYQDYKISTIVDLKDSTCLSFVYQDYKISTIVDDYFHPEFENRLSRL